MDAHPAIMVLVTLAAVAGLVGFVASIRAQNYRRDFAIWAERNFPAEWARQSWTARKLILNGALSALRQGGLQQDAGFEERYRELKRRERKVLYSIAVGVVLVAAVAAGTRLFDWQW